MGKGTTFVLGMAVGGFLVCVILGAVTSCGPPVALNVQRLRGCELAGYSTIVYDFERTIYCADVEDLMPFWEESE